MTIDDLRRRDITEEHPLLCAVSGGADSMYLLCRLREEGVPVAAAHFDHGLRGEESARDAAFVRRFCDGRGIRCVVGRGDVRAYAAARGLGIEEAARTLRYAFLEETADTLGARYIATAHTADDNAETLLLNLTRGTGTRGLGGIPPERDRILRPMLEVTRREVETYLAARDIPHVEDSSNADDRYSRNRIRHEVVPALQALNPDFVRSAGRAARLAREDDDYLTSLAGAFLRENAAGGTVDARALHALPRPVASRAVRLLAGRSLSEEHVRAVLDLCDPARVRGELSLPGAVAASEYGCLTFRREEEPAVTWPGELRPGVSAAIPELGMRVCCEETTAEAGVYSSLNIFFFKCENICGIMTCAARRPGDAIRLPGRCTKTLKKLFREARIPLRERERIPVFRDEAGLTAVCGFGAAERMTPAPGDRVWKITCLPD